MKTALGALTVVICFFLLGRKATEKERISLKQLEWMIKLIEHIKICVSASLLPLPDILILHKILRILRHLHQVVFLLLHLL